MTWEALRTLRKKGIPVGKRKRMRRLRKKKPSINNIRSTLNLTSSRHLGKRSLRGMDTAVYAVEEAERTVRY